MNITDYGFVPGSESGPGIPGRVTAVHKERYEVVCEYGETGARLKAGTYYGGSADFPTVGDFVMLRYVPDGDSLILSTLPRRTFFSRRDPDRGRGEQAVAANFDDVFLLQSLNEDFNLRRLERYLTLAWQSGTTPVIVLTKADLAEDYSGYLAAVGQVAPGVAVHLVSTKTGFGLEALQSCFRPGRTAVFLGSSGVGKSSLVNALAGEEVMSVGLIRADDGKGRHTTTHRQLLRLPGGAIIIDTPGMRELGMWGSGGGLPRCGALPGTLPLPGLHPHRRARLRHPGGSGGRRAVSSPLGQLSQPPGGGQIRRGQSLPPPPEGAVEQRRGQIPETAESRNLIAVGSTRQTEG